jgi:hypothetical protein
MNTVAAICRTITSILALTLLLAPSAFAAADAEPPALTVTTSNGQTVTTPSILVQGTATDDVALQRIRVFTGTAASGHTLLTNLPLVGRSNAWSAVLPLSPGLNYLLIRLFDSSDHCQCTLFTIAPYDREGCFQFYAVYYPSNAHVHEQNHHREFLANRSMISTPNEVKRLSGSDGLQAIHHEHEKDITPV